MGGLEGHMQRIETTDGARVLLSARERQILRLLVADRSYKLIAHDLGVSHSMVKMYVARLIDGLGCSSKLGVCLWALSHPSVIDGVAVPYDLAPHIASFARPPARSPLPVPVV